MTDSSTVLVRELVMARFPTMIAIIVRDYTFPPLNMQAVINEFRETRELILEWVIGTVNVSQQSIFHLILPRPGSDEHRQRLRRRRRLQ
jgi:hypothetical protein